MALEHRSGRFVYGLIFLGLWASFVVVDRYVIEAGYPWLTVDYEDGWFGIGLNWVTLEPMLWQRQNSPLFNQVSGLMVSFLSVDGTDKPIEQFTRITIALQGAIAFLAGIWFSWASNLVGLSRLHRGLLIVLVFTCPTLVLLSGHWGHTYVIGLLGLPLGITLFAVLQENKNALTIGGIGLGVMAANFYPSALVLVLFVLTMALQRHRAFVLAFSKQKRPFSRYEKATIALLGVCAASFAFGTYFSGFPTFGDGTELLFISGVSESIILGLVLWLVSSFLLLLLARLDASIERFLFWAASGFIVGNFVLLPWYFHGLRQAEQTLVGLTEAVNRLMTPLPNYPWVLVVWLTVLSISLVLSFILVGKWKTSLRSEGFLYGAAFALVTIIVIAFFSAGSLKLDVRDQLPWGQWGWPGHRERVFVTAIPALTIGWVILFRALRGTWLRIFQVTLVFLSLFSLGHFYQVHSKQTAEAKYDGSLLDDAIKTFFQQYPDGRLVCVQGSNEGFFSRYCRTVEVHNKRGILWVGSLDKRLSNRLNPPGGPRTKPFQPVWRLFDGRVIGLDVQEVEENARDYNAGVVEKRLTSCSGGGVVVSACYGDYVRSYADLLAAFNAYDPNISRIRKALGGGQSIEQWGRSHYQKFGKTEGRTLPTPLGNPLLVVTKGGHYRDSLIRFLEERQMTVVPLWQWWARDRNKRGQPFTNISPGDSFLAFPASSKRWNTG